MEGPTLGWTAQDRQATAGPVRDRALLALLLALAAVIHAWQIAHTAVAARDSIEFIRVAWRLQHESWPAVFRGSLHPPLYPLTVLAVSLPVRQLVHVPDSLAMQYSAQLASTLAGVLLVIPMFYLGRALFDRRVGFWSALLFQCLPVSSRALSDGLTEGLFLLLLCTGLLAGLRAFRTGSLVSFGVCGLCTGLAYLARPEGVLLGLAAGLVLLATHRIAADRWPWRRTLCAGVSLAATALAVALPYMCVIGGVTNKTSGKWIIGGPASARAEPPPAAAGGPVPVAVLLADFFPGWREGNHLGNLVWGVPALVKETGKAFHYVAWLPLLLGAWWFRGRLRSAPGAWVLVTLCALHALLLLRLTAVAGYVSERHTLIFVLCGVSWAVAGVLELPRRLAALAALLRLPAPVVDGWAHPAVGLVLLAALTAGGLPSALKMLHPSRVGHRLAGFWLAAHADPSDPVVDPFCWAHYYAGRVFLEGTRLATPPGHEPAEYVVLDVSNHHSRLPALPGAKDRAQNGKAVFQWPPAGPVQVLVYEVKK